jgi:hypothetical protein
MNNQIRIITRDRKINSKGTIVGNKCVDTLVLIADCVIIQNITSNRDFGLLQGWGFEISRVSQRFDFRIDGLIDITPTMYVQYIDGSGKLHEYKILKVVTRSILGCLWVTLYTENLNVRDTREVIHSPYQVTA